MFQHVVTLSWQMMVQRGTQDLWMECAPAAA